jgi:[acyl-carrier-protein] S-malonyltransferase
VIIIACPGQGSQTPGFLAEWMRLDGAQEFLTEASERSGVDLITHGTTSDADTQIAQPLIVAASLLAWRELSARVSLDTVGVAGHSVGEFAAAAAAGVLTEGDALHLVGVRGRAMAAAATQADTGMSAVVGGSEADVLAAIADRGLTAANRNGASQIVAAGALPALAALAEAAPRGARVIPLQVAGAFHTEYMSSAVAALESASAQVSPEHPGRPLWTNADGSRVTSGEQFVRSLVTQIANPVRWDLCLESFESNGITGFIELAPAGALSGIAKRALKGIPNVAVKTPADLDAAIQLITSTTAA